ncbi:hypothetical protein OG782_10135 [Streptomyces sp. NBC_00876]|uniref:hypothetical protein n=1 Tax=Streptomyces sp. NBC_00876 TaxID=2975853 RepID=UPI0038671C83|nr:hypothetical protein OG782_10135 [Streptomyces sp. NBC_00876]
MSGTRCARFRQLLLFAALLFGIFTMHTAGHPSEHSGPGTAMTASDLTAVDMTAADLTALDMPAAHMQSADRAAGDTAAPMTPQAQRPVLPDPMRGMDPMAVCLAVLSVWGLALLAALLVVRRTAGRQPGSAGARSPRKPRPPPPPRPPKAVLIGLSVLRI